MKLFIAIITVTIFVPCISPAEKISKRAWIEKTSKILRNGKPVAPFDNIEQLEKLSKKRIIAKFMKSIDFGDTVLDFNLYYFGMKPVRLISRYLDTPEGLSKVYSKQVFFAPQAIQSARNLMRGKNYLSFLKQASAFTGMGLLGNFGLMPKLSFGADSDPHFLIQVVFEGGWDSKGEKFI